MELIKRHKLESAGWQVGSAADFLGEVNLKQGDAILSACRTYRYILWRRWADDWMDNYAMFVGLNPSTADETLDDPTIRRCINFAKDWGYSGLVMANLFAYRATQPKDMMSVIDPVGTENDRYLLEYASKAKVVVAAWGNHGSHGGRHKVVRGLIPHLHCLKVSKTGMPSHPLYLPKTLKPVSYPVE